MYNSIKIFGILLVINGLFMSLDEARSTRKSHRGYKNTGKPCWNPQCGYKSGPCEAFCGSGPNGVGKCCRKNFRNGEKGCLKTEGGETGHRCVIPQGPKTDESQLEYQAVATTWSNTFGSYKNFRINMRVNFKKNTCPSAAKNINDVAKVKNATPPRFEDIFEIVNVKQTSSGFSGDIQQLLLEYYSKTLYKGHQARMRGQSKFKNIQGVKLSDGKYLFQANCFEEKGHGNTHYDSQQLSVYGLFKIIKGLKKVNFIRYRQTEQQCGDKEAAFYKGYYDKSHALMHLRQTAKEVLLNSNEVKIQWDKVEEQLKGDIENYELPSFIASRKNLEFRDDGHVYFYEQAIYNGKYANWASPKTLQSDIASGYQCYKDKDRVLCPFCKIAYGKQNVAIVEFGLNDAYTKQQRAAFQTWKKNKMDSDANKEQKIKDAQAQRKKEVQDKFGYCVPDDAPLISKLVHYTKDACCSKIVSKDGQKCALNESY